MKNLSIHDPLLLLLGVLLALATLVLAKRSADVRSQRLVLVNSLAPNWPLTHLLLPTLLMLLLALAIGRPILGFSTATAPVKQRSVLFLVDISLSMLAEDMSPNRLTLAKYKLQKVARELRDQNVAGTFGVVIFAGEAHLYCPLTLDLGTLEHYLDSIATDLVTASGSALLRSLEVAKDSYLKNRSDQLTLIIATDGEDPEFQHQAAAGIIKELKAHAIVLGLGTPQGAPIPIGGGGLLTDNQGNIVHTKMQKSSLQLFALESHGNFIGATLNDADVEQIVKFVKSAEMPQLDSAYTTKHNKISVPNDIGAYLVWIALLVVAVGLLLKTPNFLFCGLLILPTFSSKAIADSDAYWASKSYQAGKFVDARERFEALLARDPSNIEYLEALGAAYYKTKDYHKALETFTQLEKLSQDAATKFRSHYNLGNTQLQLGRIQAAIDHYQQALTIAPGESRALHNKSIAEALLQKQPTPTPKPTPTPTDNQQQEEQQKQEQQQEQRKQEQEQKESQSKNPHQEDKQSQEKQSQEKQSQEKQDEDPAQEDNQKEQPQATPTLATESSAPPTTPVALATPNELDQETRSWLSKLPEAPLLIPRSQRGQRRNPSGQSW